MTRTEAIAQIEQSLPALTPEQALALAELTAAWTKPRPPENDGTRKAIAQGLEQAGNGDFVSPAEVSALLGRDWK